MPTPRSWHSKHKPRLDLLLKCGLLDESLCSTATKRFMANVAAYEAMWNECAKSCQLKAEPTSADEFEPVMSTMLSLETSSWPQALVDEMVERIKGVTVVARDKSSPEAFARYLDFADRWGEYLASHPVVAARVDPVYVVVDVVGSGSLELFKSLPPRRDQFEIELHAPPGHVQVPGSKNDHANVVSDPAQAEPPLPLPIDQSTFIWSFPNKERASSWCDSLHKTYPGMKIWMFTCAQACVRW